MSGTGFPPTDSTEILGLTCSNIAPTISPDSECSAAQAKVQVRQPTHLAKSTKISFIHRSSSQCIRSLFKFLNPGVFVQCAATSFLQLCKDLLQPTLFHQLNLQHPQLRL